MKLALIGKGAIAQFVCDAAKLRGHVTGSILVRPEALAENPELYIGSLNDLPEDTDIVIDCAGHQALAEHGPDILASGMDLITVSLGVLADQRVADNLETAARDGNATLHLASGAIGALDSLKAAAVGKLVSVVYVGRKPPAGWRGSPAETKLDLDALTTAQTHFDGSARHAALEYPKNANVAAAVALTGLGMDDTKVRLIADPAISQNVHEIEAEGDFGQFRFQISGNSLPGSPRSSALAAMSILAKLDQISQPVSI